MGDWNLPLSLSDCFTFLQIIIVKDVAEVLYIINFISNILFGM
jgi:hypothetical protein